MLHDQYIMHKFRSQKEGVLALENAGFQLKELVDVLGYEVLPGVIPDNHPIIPGSDPKLKRHKTPAYIESSGRLVRCNCGDPVMLSIQGEIMEALYSAGIVART